MLKQTQAQDIEKLKQASIRWVASHGLGLPEAEDIFQQALLKAISHPLKQMKKKKLPAWFFRILKNTLTDEFRKNKLHSEKMTEYQHEQTVLEAEIVESLCKCVNKLILDLSKSEQTILEKHFYEGKKFKELAEEFDQSEVSIRVKATRARQKLKKLFRACCSITHFDETKDCACD